MVSGSLGETSFSSSYLFSSEISLGEKGIDGEIHYGFSHNNHHLILSTLRKDTLDHPSPDMFRSFSVLDTVHYEPFDVKETGSEVRDSFVVVTFLKGSKEIEDIAKAGLICRKVPDVANSWSAFDIYHIYSFRSQFLVILFNNFFTLKLALLLPFLSVLV